MENKNGQGIFYGVIGVATLIVAIIGATFAYFSASVTANGDNVAGETLDLAGALSVSVTKLSFDDATAASNNLVPASIAVDNETKVPTVAGITAALTANCEKDGYTGCHVYKIEASSTTQIDEAEIKLETLTTTNTANKSDWKYVIYKGTDTSATSVVANGSMDLAAPLNMHATDRVLTDTPVVYYLMIYLAEDNATDAQNNGEENDATGSYSGTVDLSAGSGHVTANFIG